MINYFISILFSCLLASCSANSLQSIDKKANEQVNQLVVNQMADQLKKEYKKLSSNPNVVEFQEDYFNAFPNSFQIFNSLFGYSDKDPFGNETFVSPLYKESEGYIDVFFKLNKIEKTRYFNRIIDISINGRWYADGVSYFKHRMEEKINEDINLFSKLLIIRDDMEIQKFWYFYFDGPHPIKTLPDELQKVKEINGRLFLIMELALKEVQQNWKE